MPAGPTAQDGYAPQDSDAGQHQQLPKRQAEQQGGKNHENDANGLETKALPDRRDQEHSGEENGNAYILISRLSRFCALVGHVYGLFRQTKKLLVLGVVIVWHEDRARRRLRVVEWVRAHPCSECRSVFFSKAPLEELRRLCLAIELGGQPTVEGIAVVDPLLSCQRGKPFSCNSESTRLGVLLCAFSGPLC